MVTLVAAAVAALGVSFGARFAQAEEPAREQAPAAKKAKAPSATQDAAPQAEAAPAYGVSTKERTQAGKGAPRAPSGGTAKRGEACKSDADCDNSSGDMKCAKSKCEFDVSRVHPAT
jgi:hypothetical protein